MNPRELDLETRVRRWMDETAPDQAPASLLRTVDRVTAVPPARPARLGLALRTWRLAQVAAAAAVIVALVIGGGYLFRTIEGPAGPTPNPTPSAFPSQTGIWLAKPQLVTSYEATVPVLAGRSSVVLASGWDPRGDGGTCRKVPARIIAGTGQVAETTGWDGEIFAMPPQYNVAGMFAVGMDASCKPALLMLDDKGAWTATALDPGVGLLEGVSGRPELFGRGIAIWNPNTSVVEFRPARDVLVTRPAIAAPLGTDADGMYFVDPSRQVRLVRAAGETGVEDVTPGPALQLPAGTPGRGVLFRDGVVFEEANGGLGFGRLDGSVVNDTFRGFSVWQIDAGYDLVAAIGTFQGHPALAVSMDGVDWVWQTASAYDSKQNGSTAAVAVTADHVFYGAQSAGGQGVSVYSVAVTRPGLQSQGPEASASAEPQPTDPVATPTPGPSATPTAPSTVPAKAPEAVSAALQASHFQLSAMAFGANGRWIMAGGDGTEGVVAFANPGAAADPQIATLGRDAFNAAAISSDGAVMWAGRGCESNAACDPGIWMSADSGMTWQRVSSERPKSLAFADATHGWAVLAGGTGAVGGGPAGVVATTADGGRTWTKLASPCAADAGTPIAISGPAADIAYLACTGAGSPTNASKSIVATSDAARTWTVVASRGGGQAVGQMPANGHLFGVAFAADGAGMAWYGGYLAQWTRDGGATWTPWSYGSGQDRMPIAAAVTPDGVWLLAADLNAQNTDVIQISTDQGRTWTDWLTISRK